MKERYQNPVIADVLKLRLFTYNSNSRADVESMEEVNIYFLDPTFITTENPDGRRLVATIGADDIVHEETGHYSVEITLEKDVFTIGKYIDVWKLVVRENEAESNIEQHWVLYPDLWFSTPMPPVYDFSFSFRPNRIRQGSKRYLLIDVTPNVPHASDLLQYYVNLITVSPIKISMEQGCVDCMPAEQDLRLVIDKEDVGFRERCVAYYFLDTSELACGIYNVWFEMEFGENTYISEKQEIEIF